MNDEHVKLVELQGGPANGQRIKVHPGATAFPVALRGAGALGRVIYRPTRKRTHDGVPIWGLPPK